MAKKKDLSQLDLDLIQCEKDGFGCHYGKWKATQEQKKIELKEPSGFSVRICENCGEEFVRDNNRPCKYCCDRCRRQAEYQAYKERKQNG